MSDEFQWVLMAASMSTKLVFALAALWLASVALRALDRRGGLDWTTKVYPKIFESSVATATYFGCRIIAVAILLGLVIAG